MDMINSCISLLNHRGCFPTRDTDDTQCNTVNHYVLVVCQC